MERIKIDDALREHANLMKLVRENCKEDIEKDVDQFNDDLFLLRFCISHSQNPERCVEAVKKTIDFRIKNKETLDRVRNGTRHEDEVLMSRYSPFGHHGFSKFGDPLVVIRTGYTNNPLLLAKMTEDQIRNAIIFQKEFMHGICDRESRKRGHICKMISFADLKGLGLFDTDRHLTSLMGKAMEESELYWPCLLGKMFIMNAPGFIAAVLAIAELFLPAKTFAKLARCKGTTRKQSISTCPFATQFLDLDQLPTFLGGTCECKEKGGCIGGTPNDLAEKVFPNGDPSVPDKKKQ